MSRFSYWIPSILYASLIFYLSSHPSPDAARWWPIIYKLKIIHVIEYGVLYLLFWWAAIKTTSFNGIEPFLLAFSMTVLFGLTDEFHQIFVQGRTARFEDVFADGVGACVAQAINLLSGYRRS